MAANLPPIPAQSARRGRGRPRHMSGPRNVLSGPHANADLNNVHRGQIAQREQAEIHRQNILDGQLRQAVLLQQLEEQRNRELEEERQRELAQAQILDELRQLDWEHQGDHAADNFPPPEVNGQVRNLIHDQWRAEHERELDHYLVDDFDFDDFDVDDWQRLDDAIAQAFPMNEQQAADVHEENRRFEK